jgi:carboxyl-terminal processing protease
VEKIPDSLMKEFSTKGGRFVYDGSGIYPDVFMDARKYSPITIALANKNYIFDYATKFRAKNSSVNTDANNFTLTETEYADFLAYISDKEYDYSTKTEKQLDEFKTIAENEKYFEDVKAEYDALKKKVSHNKTDDLNKNKDEIKLYLESEIASRYFYQHGRLKVNQRGDKELKEAMSLLANTTLMRSILKGEGSYKIIGKPKDGSSPKPDDKKPNSPGGDKKDSPIPPDKKPEKKKKG